MSFNEDSFILSRNRYIIIDENRKYKYEYFKERTSKLVSFSDGDKTNAHDICCALRVFTHMRMYLYEMYTRLCTLTRVH